MKIQAEIVKYYKDGLNIDQGEETEWFDEITLKILSPDFLKGYKVTIFVDESMIEDNPWNQVGTIINFDYDDSIKDFNKYHIFANSLTNVEFNS